MQVVEQFAHLDLECEQELQQIIKLTGKLFRSAYASISIIDESNGQLVVKTGANIDDASGQVSLRYRTLQKSSPLIIADTYRDERSAQHPNVQGNGPLRFYAGTRLLTREGHQIGTICVMDAKSHKVSGQQILMLKMLARHAVSVMELKLSLVALSESLAWLQQEKASHAESNMKLRALFESLADAYFLLGKEGEIMDYNKAAYSVMKEKFGCKIKRGELLGDHLAESYRAIFDLHRLAALAGERTQLERFADYGLQGQIWWYCIFEPVRDTDGQIIGVSYVARNINERKRYEQRILEQNAVLTRVAEIQAHDYRAPVASILGMMNLIEAENYETPKEYLLILRQAVDKLDEKIREAVDLINEPLLALQPAAAGIRPDYY